MAKNNKNDNIEIDELNNMLPDILDRKHQMIPIVTNTDDESMEDVNVPEILPILTLRSSVLFPGAITPITVGREKSIALVRAVNSEGGLLGAVLQRNGEIENPSPDDMYRVGTAARILKILEMPNGNLTVILSGLEKSKSANTFRPNLSSRRRLRRCSTARPKRTAWSSTRWWIRYATSR